MVSGRGNAKESGATSLSHTSNCWTTITLRTSSAESGPPDHHLDTSITLPSCSTILFPVPASPLVSPWAFTCTKYSFRGSLRTKKELVATLWSFLPAFLLKPFQSLNVETPRGRTFTFTPDFTCLAASSCCVSDNSLLLHIVCFFFVLYVFFTTVAMETALFSHSCCIRVKWEYVNMLVYFVFSLMLHLWLVINHLKWKRFPGQEAGGKSGASVPASRREVPENTFDLLEMKHLDVNLWFRRCRLWQEL